MIDIKVDKENLTELSVQKTEVESFGLFKQVFSRSMGALMKVNFLVILFAIPALFIAFFFILQTLQVGYFLPYSGNIAIGYPIAYGVDAYAESLRGLYTNMMYIWLLPCMFVVSVALAGAFHVIKMLIVDDVPVVKNFFSGIKKHFTQVMISTLMLSASSFCLLFYINNYDFVTIAEWLKVILMVVDVIQFVIIAMMSIFMFTQATNYKMKFTTIISNSFRFAIALTPFNVIIIVFSALPIALLYLVWGVDLLNVIVIMASILFLFSYVILIWTVYGNWTYARFITEKSNKK